MTVFQIIAISVLVVLIVCLLCIWYDSTHFHKVYYRLSSSKISKPVKFVLLTDLHDKEFGPENKDLLKAIDSEQPDAVLIAGDMLTASQEGYKDVSLKLIKALAGKHRVYHGPGNHESKMNWGRSYYGEQYDTYVEALQNTGAVVLRNEAVDFPGLPIRIYGLDMDRAYYKRLEPTPMAEDYVESKLGRADEAYYNILLAHNPAYFDRYVLWKPDLVLSGHVHGGMVRLPLLGGVIAPSLQLFPEYDGGRFTKDDSTMILSRGLGIHGIEFRLWNPGELVVIELVPQAD